MWKQTHTGIKRRIEGDLEREDDRERWNSHYDKGGESFGRKLYLEQCSSNQSLLRGEVERTKLGEN